MICDAVICAHNEDKTIGAIISAAQSSPLVRNVLVIADACEDFTAHISRYNGASVFAVDFHDKGSAMAYGVRKVTAPGVLFLDADIYGMKEHWINLLCSTDSTGQVVGLRHDPLGVINALKIPPIGGERRLNTRDALRIDLNGSGWEAETRINAYMGRHGLQTKYIYMDSVRNPTKLWNHPLEWLKEMGLVWKTNMTKSGDLIKMK